MKKKIISLVVIGVLVILQSCTVIEKVIGAPLTYPEYEKFAKEPFVIDEDSEIDSDNYVIKFTLKHANGRYYNYYLTENEYNRICYMFRKKDGCLRKRKR
jgi:hypothetical protein